MKSAALVLLTAAALCVPVLSVAGPAEAVSAPVSMSRVTSSVVTSAETKRYYVTVTAIGSEARVVGTDTTCKSKDFKTGQRGKIVGKNGKTLGHGTLGQCRLHVSASIPGIGAVASPTFFLSMDDVALQKRMKLVIGKHSWPLTYADFVAYGLDLNVSVEDGVSAAR